jgi:hypothetical protein
MRTYWLIGEEASMSRKPTINRRSMSLRLPNMSHSKGINAGHHPPTGAGGRANNLIFTHQLSTAADSNHLHPLNARGSFYKNLSVNDQRSLQPSPVCQLAPAGSNVAGADFQQLMAIPAANDAMMSSSHVNINVAAGRRKFGSGCANGGFKFSRLPSMPAAVSRSFYERRCPSSPNGKQTRKRVIMRRE